MNAPKAIAAISSKAVCSVLNSLLGEFSIPCAMLTSGQELLESLSNLSAKNLGFVSLEVLREIDHDPAEALRIVRKNFYGSLFVISVNANSEEIRELIQHGATDIIPVTDFDALRSILNTYSIYHQISTLSDPLTALVVEDSATQRKVITTVLEQRNVEVLNVPTAREAIMVLRMERVDMVFTDIHLQGDMTGMHLLREMCQSTAWQGIPTFVVSGVVHDSQFKEYYRLGVRDFMVKPLDVELFEIKVDNVIRERLSFLTIEKDKKALREMAYTDTMTGLKNRAYLKAMYPDWVSSHTDFYAMMMRLDNIRRINEEVGHDAGDDMVRSAGNQLTSCLEEGEILIRLGTDEFAGLLAGTDEAEVRARAEKMLSLLKDIDLNYNIPVNACIGLVKLHSKVSLADMLRRCEVSLYSASHAGQGAIEID